MKDFLDQLDERLQTMASLDQPSSSRAQPRRDRRRPAMLAGATATLAALGTVFALGGTSLAGLPILDTPTTDATPVSRAADAARSAGVDFSRAHTFETESGPGYVFTTEGDRVVCLALPNADGRYPGTCSAREAVEADGLAFELTADQAVDPQARSQIAFVLPEDAEQARLAPTGGTARAARTVDGVVAETLAGPATLSWTVDGVAGSRTFDGPFPAIAPDVTVTCPDGRRRTLSPDDAAAAVGRIAPAAIRRACR